MLFKKFPVTEYVTNCYLLADEQSREAAVIDPGSVSESLIKAIEENNLNVKYVLLTHGHYDHISGINFFKEKYNAVIAIHTLDAPYLEDASLYDDAPDSFSFPGTKADKELNDGDIIHIGSLELKIIHTPGHTKGGISILCGDILLSGDTLFNNSIGRTDFKDGDYQEIEQSVRKLYTLPEDTIVYPGHGFRTSIGKEKKNNPFVRMP